MDQRRKDKKFQTPGKLMKAIKLVVEETRDGARISWTFGYDKQPTPKLPQMHLAAYLKELTRSLEAKEAVMVGFAQDSVKRIYRDELLVERSEAGAPGKE